MKDPLITVVKLLLAISAVGLILIGIEYQLLQEMPEPITFH